MILYLIIIMGFSKINTCLRNVGVMFYHLLNLYFCYVATKEVKKLIAPYQIIANNRDIFSYFLRLVRSYNIQRRLRSCSVISTILIPRICVSSVYNLVKNAYHLYFGGNLRDQDKN